MRRPSPAAIILAVFALLAWWMIRSRSASIPVPPRPAAVAPAAAPSGPTTAAPAATPVVAGAAKPADPERSTLLDDLNQPAGTIQSDLRLMQEVFVAWRTNFPRDGNPVGENAEITRALTGANALKLALVPKDHPAVNPGGELTDRWGTPFRFHQLSGTRMEIRSAGPDRSFGTADDAVLTP
jgi:hypothetical protein